jgi:hypothetical protein
MACQQTRHQQLPQPPTGSQPRPSATTAIKNGPLMKDGIEMDSSAPNMAERSIQVSFFIAARLPRKTPAQLAMTKASEPSANEFGIFCRSNSETRQSR